MNRYDDQARLTFHLAREEANRLGHAQVGPEHLLLGLMRVEGGGRDVLLGLGADLDRMREQVRAWTLPGPGGAMNEAPAITPPARQVMEAASQEARALRSPITSTPHILLGLVRVEHPVTRRVLASVQADAQVIMDHARAKGILPAQGAQQQAQERAQQVQALRRLLEETLGRDGTPPAGMTEDELMALVVGGGDSSLISLFEDVVYRWMTGDGLSESRKHAVLLLLINFAMQKRG
ncbi:Clp protease N-terminal domain-containing protein [Deinococcus aestuarii]|uniref:Clp protease N-terminal domain-containing protein n=1 Tax=Deinococcus aestuarii TaxID=2774531 RepID=UPI001C0CDB0B